MPNMDNLMNNKAVMLGLSVLAFLVAAVLVIMIFRMLFGGRLRMSGGRARQARLGIVDAFDLDRQRQLIIVRRDNTEHLIMIGGPNDVVIESEIVRAEVRDLRDQRRDPVTGDTRGIPAPAPALEKASAAIQGIEKPLLSRPTADPRQAVPAQPIETRSDAVAEMPRASATFPLPPRRPPPTPAPDRRPATPPKLPESVSRGEEIPSLSGQPSAPAPAPPVPVLPVSRPAATSSPRSSQQSGTASVARPPFLKPLAPRPPARPLQRTTPQAPAIPGSVPGRGSNPQSNDALESLEEEMAKLLGRGS